MIGGIFAIRRLSPVRHLIHFHRARDSSLILLFTSTFPVSDIQAITNFVQSTVRPFDRPPCLYTLFPLTTSPPLPSSSVSTPRPLCVIPWQKSTLANTVSSQRPCRKLHGVRCRIGNPVAGSRLTASSFRPL